MLPDVGLGLPAHGGAGIRIVIKAHHRPGKVLRLVGDPHDIPGLRNAFRPDGCGDDDRAVINGLHHLALDTCPIP